MKAVEPQAPEILCYGEALVDLLPLTSGVALADVDSFTRVPGGAPSNLAIGLARLGIRSALLGKVGADPFGDYLIGALASEGVDARAVRQTSSAKTGLTFISLDRHGERSFFFVREPSADMTIASTEIDGDIVSRTPIFVLGTNLLVASPSREATLRARGLAAEQARYIVVDPNVRLHMWGGDARAAHGALVQMCAGADLVKMNAEELAFYASGEPSAFEGSAVVDAEAFFHEHMAPAGVGALVVTLGAAGAIAITGGLCVRVAAPRTDVRDTTGAGDGFLAGLLAALVRIARRRGPLTAVSVRDAVSALGPAQWDDICSVGCYVGSAVCERLGATPALPFEADLPWSRWISMKTGD